MKHRVLLFGASDGGRQTLRQISRRIQVVAFLDSDPAKQGTMFEGYPVEPPERAVELEYDYILISSMHVDPIRQRLLELGVQSERIASGLLYINSPPSFPWDAVLFAGTIGVCGLAATAVAIALALD